MADAINFSDLLTEAVTKPGFLSDAYHAFHTYSFGNCLAAAFQLGQRGLPLQPISSFMGWQKVGRKVKKGSKALVLCMPVTCNTTKVDKSTGQEVDATFQKFVWLGKWFALCDTEGEAAASQPIAIPGWDPDLALATLGVTQEEFSMADGNCQGYAYGKTIAISPLAQYPHKTRFHELAHVVLGHTTERMVDGENTVRSMAEVEAESTAYILVSLLKLPGLEESRGYIQHWLRDADIPEKNAQRIFKTVDRILKAGRPAEPAAPEVQTPAPEAKPEPTKAAKRSPKKDAQRANRKAKAAPECDPRIEEAVKRGALPITALVAKGEEVERLLASIEVAA